MDQKHYDVTTGSNGDVLVIEDSGKFAMGGLEDDVCHVYGGNDADTERAKDDAYRIAYLLNLARNVSTEDLVNGTSVLLNTSAAMGPGELGGYMAELSSLHEREGFSLSTNRDY